METLLLARAKYLLDRVSNNVNYPTLDGSPALPTEAAALIECLGKLGLDEDADAMRKDFIVYFAHEVRLPKAGLDPRLAEFVLKANELFGPFLKYSGPKGDCTVVRLRLIDHFDGLRITFKKLSMLTSPLLPPAQRAGADEGDDDNESEMEFTTHKGNKYRYTDKLSADASRSEKRKWQFEDGTWCTAANAEEVYRLHHGNLRKRLNEAALAGKIERRWTLIDGKPTNIFQCKDVERIDADVTERRDRRQT